MRDLIEVRDDIDKVDKEILSLYEKRLSLSNEVAEYKKSVGKPVFDKEREDEKIETLTAGIKDKYVHDGVRELFTELMNDSKKLQYREISKNKNEIPEGFSLVPEIDTKDKTVAFQGTEGSFGEQAVYQYFGESVKAVAKPTFFDVVKSLTEKEVDYAVLPIENSRAGSVYENYDLMLKFDVAIVAEVIVDIRHNLLALPGAKLSEITDVYSHPQALMQCSEFLNGEGKNMKKHEYSNTALAAKMVAGSGDHKFAAIASKRAAEEYGLEIIRENIQDDSQNQTRFVILSLNRFFSKKSDIISICVSLKDSSGTLYHTLSHFAKNGLNMISIESRPIIGRDWEYRFFIDFEGNLLSDNVRFALYGLSEEMESMKILGNYKSGRVTT